MINLLAIAIAALITMLLLIALRPVVKRRRAKGESVTFWQWIERVGWVVGIFAVVFAVVFSLSNSGPGTPPPASSSTRYPDISSPPVRPSPTSSSQPDNAGRAPWDGPQLKENDVPTVLAKEWRRAKNRASCAPIAPQALGDGVGAQARRATFLGGWGITYEHSGGTFTIAGTDLPASDGVDGVDPWRYYKHWDDGSIAGYGTEGGQYAAGPDATSYIAYLTIPGQDCLYNISSELGKRHLEYLLSHLRFVKVSA